MGNPTETLVERLVERVGGSYFGKYRGIVTDVDDPANQCCIRAKVPAVLGDQPCGWALPVAAFAGDGHGVVLLPEVGAGVWIEFEAGQLDRPLWSGAWWAEGQRPDPQGPGKRVFVSKNGHKLVMDDDSDELLLTHGSGPEIKMTGTEVTITCGACEVKITSKEISLNNGLIKVGLAGVSLVNGAMAFGVPP